MFGKLDVLLKILEVPYSISVSLFEAAYYVTMA